MQIWATSFMPTEPAKSVSEVMCLSTLTQHSASGPQPKTVPVGTWQNTPYGLHPTGVGAQGEEVKV